MQGRRGMAKGRRGRLRREGEGEVNGAGGIRRKILNGSVGELLESFAVLASLPPKASPGPLVFLIVGPWVRERERGERGGR